MAGRSSAKPGGGQAVAPDRLRFELPFTAKAPRLVNPAIGIDRVVVLHGAGRRMTTDTTILDSPDHRLLRAGIVLAHRVSEQRGEWYLSASEWAPWLPVELVEPMADGDLPESITALIRPFHRTAPLGPVAALEDQRWVYAALGPAGEQVALLNDQLVTVRVAGVITSRFREATLVGETTDAQRDWIIEMLASVGGSAVESFPTLAQRIGSPATGRTDFPAPVSWDDATPVDTVLGSIMAGRLRMIMTADLAMRDAGHSGDPRDLVEQLRTLAVELRGMLSLLGTDRGSSTEAGILADRLSGADPDHITQVINGGRYLNLIDALVQAVRSPRLSDGLDTKRPPSARTALSELLARGRAELIAAADELSASGPDSQWRTVWAAAQQLVHASTVTALVRPKRSARLRRRTERLMALLEECLDEPPALTDRLGELTASEAFEAGRSFERAYVVRQHARNDFVRTWARIRENF